MLSEKDIETISKLIKESEKRVVTLVGNSEKRVIKKIEETSNFHDKQNIHTAKRVSTLEIKLGFEATAETPR